MVLIVTNGDSQGVLKVDPTLGAGILGCVKVDW